MESSDPSAEQPHDEVLEFNTAEVMVLAELFEAIRATSRPDELARSGYQKGELAYVAMEVAKSDAPYPLFIRLNDKNAAPYIAWLADRLRARIMTGEGELIHDYPRDIGTSNLVPSSWIAEQLIFKLERVSAEQQNGS